MQRKKYDKAFRMGAVVQVVEEAQSVSSVSQALGILPTTDSVYSGPRDEACDTLHILSNQLRDTVINDELRHV